MSALDTVAIARVLFASTAGVHYLFVATTLGLGPLVAVLSTRAALRPSATRDRTLQVAGRMYVVNYAVGIVTGLVMELQMALVWSGPGAVVYDPVATMLALETVLAFFLESTLLGIWLASTGILGRGVRAALFWAVTLTAYVSAALIVGANSFLHAPFELDAGAVTLDDVARLVIRPASLTVLAHVIASSLVVGGFWVAAAGARVAHRGGHDPVARHLVRLGVTTVAWAAPLAVVSGVSQFPTVRPGHGDPGVFAVALALMMLVGVVLTLATWVLLPFAWTGGLTRRAAARRALMIGPVAPLATTFLGWLYREEARQPWFVVDRVATVDAMTPLPHWLLSAMCVVFLGIGMVAAVTAWRLMTAAMHTCAVSSPGSRSDRELEPVGWIA